MAGSDSAFNKMFGPTPQAKSAPKAGLLRPSFVRKPTRNVDAWFDADALWAHVSMEARKSRGEELELPLVQITHPRLDSARAAEEAAYFFGVQKDVVGVDERTAWERVLTPILDDVEETLNAKRPPELRGKLRFDVAPDSSLTLFYLDK